VLGSPASGPGPGGVPLPARLPTALGSEVIESRLVLRRSGLNSPGGRSPPRCQGLRTDLGGFDISHGDR